MRLLPFLALAGCSEIPADLQEKCGDEIAMVETTCEEAQVIGEHENTDLYAAVNEARKCLGNNVHVVCSDDGWQHITKWTYGN